MADEFYGFVVLNPNESNKNLQTISTDIGIG